MRGRLNMLTLGDFETVAGAAAITLAVVKVLTSMWPKAPRIWILWAAAECTVFAGGLMRGPITWQIALELFFSGMVVAATALGSGSGGEAILQSFNRRRSKA